MKVSRRRQGLETFTSPSRAVAEDKIVLCYGGLVTLPSFKRHIRKPSQAACRGLEGLAEVGLAVFMVVMSASQNAFDLLIYAD